MHLKNLHDFVIAEFEVGLTFDTMSGAILGHEGLNQYVVIGGKLIEELF